MSHTEPKLKTIEDSSVLSSGVVKRLTIEASDEARRIIDDAERKAESIRVRMEMIEREARESARRSGYQEGLLQLNTYLLDAREKRESALIEAQHDLLRLAVRIAEKIIGHEIDRDETVLAGIVATALENARRNEFIRLRVNPADFSILQKHRNQLDPSSRARFLEIAADPGVSHGGCIIETESATIDARLETQLAVLERALLMDKSAQAYEDRQPLKRTASTLAAGISGDTA